MEKLDLSTYAKEIKSNYDAVVSGEKTYVIYTTLKDSSLKPTTLGDGDIKDFVSEFEEGSVQFGVIRVNPFGSDVQKIILLGWCPDSAPIKSKVSYATNFSNVGKILHYHVDITARDSDDLSIEDIMKTVSNASGARYSIQSLTPTSSTGSKFKPTPKPASPAPEVAPIKLKPAVAKPKSLPLKTGADSTDGWGDEEEIKERDFSKNPLETLPSAYKPTKVDMHALRSGKSQEKEATSILSSTTPKTATISINPSGGLTSLPKPKPSNSVLSRYNQTSEVVKPAFGTKAPVFDSTPLKDSSKLVGGLSKNFGAEGGKTPAQIWAEKKGQYKDVPHDSKPVNSQGLEKNIEHENAVVNDVKSKFEQLDLQAEKEQIEDTVKSGSSFPPPPERENTSFPPPPARENTSFPPPPARENTSFPPPPAREKTSFPPPTSDSFSKFQEEEVESQGNDDAWEDDTQQKVEKDSQPAPATRSLPPRPTPGTHEAANPIDISEQEPTPAVDPSTSAGNIAVAEYDYEKDEDNEIGFLEGETIVNIEFVDDDWWQGTNKKGETGLFPASYVTLKEKEDVSEATPISPSLPTRESKATPVKEGPSATAEFDYDASEDNELTFKEGDIITDIDTVDDDWWLGSCNGERKLFPSNYVRLN